jgi:hypothetical protein
MTRRLAILGALTAMLLLVGAEYSAPTPNLITTSALDIYVNGGLSTLDGGFGPDGGWASAYGMAVGDDRYSCRSATKPCKTITAALIRIPHRVRHPVRVWVAPGTYAENIYLDSETTGEGSVAVNGVLVTFGPDAGSSYFKLGSQTGTPNNWSYLIEPVSADGGTYSGGPWLDRAFKGALARNTTGVKAQSFYGAVLTTSVYPITEMSVPSDGGQPFVTLADGRNGLTGYAGNVYEVMRPATILTGGATNTPSVEATGSQANILFSNLTPTGASTIYGLSVGRQSLNAMEVTCQSCLSNRGMINVMGGQFGLNWVIVRLTPAQYTVLEQMSVSQFYLHSSILLGEASVYCGNFSSLGSAMAYYYGTAPVQSENLYAAGSIFDLTLRSIPPPASHALVALTSANKNTLYHSLLTGATGSGVVLQGPTYLGIHTVDINSSGAYGIAAGSTSTYRDINIQVGIHSSVNINNSATADLYAGPYTPDAGISLNDLRTNYTGKTYYDPITGNRVISQ